MPIPRRSLSAALASSPALERLRPAELRSLARIARESHLPADWTFISEHTPADACFLVLAGEVEVACEGELRRLGPGELLGELALIRQSLRTARCTTRTPVRLLRLSYEDLAPVLTRHPAVREVLVGVMRGREVVTT